MATLDSRVLMSLTLFKLSLIAGHLGCLQCLNTINNTAGPPGFSPPRLDVVEGVGKWNGDGDRLLPAFLERLFFTLLAWTRG